MSINTINITLNNEEDTQNFAKQLADIDITGTVWLAGDLGAGKTTLTRYWLRALGHEGKVKSPTYTLVEPYEFNTKLGTKPVYHCDLYRLQDPEELEYIGFDEYIEENNSLVIIEWASRAVEYLPEPVLTVAISKEDNEQRTVCLNGSLLANSELFINLQQAFVNVGLMQKLNSRDVDISQPLDNANIGDDS